MKNIKFRVWDEHNNKLYYVPKLNFGYLGCGDPEDGYPCFYGIRGHSFTCGGGIVIENKLIHFQQYIGNKDKNGKEIYEGDIVHYLFDGDSYPNEAVDKNLVCVYDEHNTWFIFNENLTDSDGGYYWLEIRNYCEVIGNIYETPDLIK